MIDTIYQKILQLDIKANTSDIEAPFICVSPSYLTDKGEDA